MSAVTDAGETRFSSLVLSAPLDDDAACAAMAQALDTAVTILGHVGQLAGFDVVAVMGSHKNRKRQSGGGSSRD